MYQREYFDATGVHSLLVRSRSWITPLHHLEALSADEARALLTRDPYMIYERAERDTGRLYPTPLARARELLDSSSGAEATQKPQGASSRLRIPEYKHCLSSTAAARVVIARWRWLKAFRLVRGLCDARWRAAHRIFCPGGPGYQESAESFALARGARHDHES